jgi:hypothetical protein
MTDFRERMNPSDDFNRPQPERPDPPHPRFAQLEEHPELIPVVRQAVDEVITSRNLNRERHADLVMDAEQAAAAAALTTYERMVLSAIQAADATNDARQARAHVVAATAAGIADVVTETAAEVHNVEEAAADYVAVVAANAASKLATLVKLDDETAASTAAALVIKAVSEAAAVNTEATADAASSVAQAAADAAADIAGQAACTALAAESDMITNAFDRHRDTLKTCYEDAAGAAQAVLTPQSGANPFHPHHPPEIHRTPA